jgi:hypothetical protein
MKVTENKTPSHYEYRDGMKIRVFDDPPDTDPTGDKRMVKPMLLIAVLLLILLTIGMLGCANADRVLWDLLG